MFQNQANNQAFTTNILTETDINRKGEERERERERDMCSKNDKANAENHRVSFSYCYMSCNDRELYEY